MRATLFSILNLLNLLIIFEYLALVVEARRSDTASCSPVPGSYDHNMEKNRP
jgi:hypothetical protein